MKDPHFKRESRKYEHPIPSREAILSCMEKLGEPVSLKKLAGELLINSNRDQESLKLRMRAMVRDGQVVGRRSVYAIASKMELFAGKVSAHPDGFGFLLCDEDREDIFLHHRQMRAVFHGDRVLARIRGKDGRGREEGEIVEVLAHNTTELVGRVYFEKKVALFESLNRRIVHEILIENPGAKLREGQIVAARITRPPGLHNLAAVEVESVLGEHLTPDMEVEIALRNNDIPLEFPNEVIEEADSLPLEVQPSQKRRREDLRQLDFVTIDGEDARDFDDAVYCERRSKGGFRLLVAIADVAHYVKPGTSLDDEAYKRGTSVYFPQYVTPMLPEKLSNGLCSLNPDVDRLVMVCEMTISNQGRIGSYQFYEGVIRSSERLTYTQVGRWFEEKAFPRHEESLAAMVDLALLMSRVRKEQGALDFDTIEVRFTFDDDGRVSGVFPVTRNFAHRLIEECMLCANVCAARLVEKSGLPGLFRIHEKPEEEKTASLREFLASFDIDLGKGQGADYQAAIDNLRGRENGQILQIALLRAMQQAVYGPQNLGHFGLAYSHYTHFTSPIRRYPDLLVHRLIKSLIHSNQDLREVRRFGKPGKQRSYPYDASQVLAQGEHLSFTERRADSAVYEVLEWVKCDYLGSRLGDDFKGAISSVTRFGFFVQLEGVYVEGLVHVSTLVGDYYRFNVGDQRLIGERTGAAFGLGDVVTVQVARVDADERKIDLELLTHSPISRRQRPKKKRPAGKSRKQGQQRKQRRQVQGRRRRR